MFGTVWIAYFAIEIQCSLSKLTAQNPSRKTVGGHIHNFIIVARVYLVCRVAAVWGVITGQFRRVELPAMSSTTHVHTSSTHCFTHTHTSTARRKDIRTWLVVHLTFTGRTWRIDNRSSSLARLSSFFTIIVNCSA